MNDSALQRDGDSARAIAHTKFPEDIFDKPLDRSVADLKLRCNLFVALAFGEEPKNFEFTRSQSMFAGSRIEPSLNFRWDATQSSPDSTDGFDDNLPEGPLEQIALRPGLQGSIDVFIAIVGSQYNKAACGELAANGCDRFDAADAGKSQVHQRHVRLMTTKKRNCILTSFGFSHDLQIGLKANHRSEALPDNRMIVHDHQSDLSIHGICSSDKREVGSWRSSCGGSFLRNFSLDHCPLFGAAGDKQFAA